MLSTFNTSLTILRSKQVLARTGLSRSTLYQKLDKKSAHFDPSFPTQVKLGANSVGWIESEITAWIESRVQASRNFFHVEK